MDKKDEIILQQLELIKNMTRRNLKNTANDFWGAPAKPAAPAAPKQAEEEKKKEASSIDAPPADKKEEELPEPEKIEDL